MLNIGWGLTSKCNLNCEFCYSKSARENINDITDIFVLKEFIDHNFHLVNSVNYGTGENTLSGIWIEIIKHINERFPNVTQGLTTNGYLSELLVKDLNAKRIILECIEEIDVSLDFGNKESHNKFRGNSQVYNWVIQTLEYSKKYNKRAAIVFVGTNETLKIPNIKNLFAIAKKYDAIIRLNLYRPTNIQERYFIPNFDAIKQALEFINDNYNILSLSDPLFSAIFTKGEVSCIDPSGISSIRILPDGSITPSTYLITDEFKKLNIRIGNVLDKLKDSEFINLIDHSVPDECADCPYKFVCRGGAVDRRYLWYRDFNRKDPYCPFTKDHVIDISKLKITHKSNFSSVHDGYLPTLFFSN